MTNDRLSFTDMVRLQWANVPNLVSVARGFLSLLVVFLLVEHSAWAVVVYAFTALTDCLDGWWARHFHQETQLGKMLDPIVDKLLVLSAGVGICIAQPELWVIILIGIILIREAVVVVLVETLRRKGLALSVTWQGKLKTAAQGIAFFMLMLPLPSSWMQMKYYALIIAVILTAVSGVDYLVRAKQMIKR